MAWLRRKGNAYYVYWRDGGRGSPTRVQRVGPKKAEALKLKAEIEHRRISARFGITVPDPIPFARFADRWLRSRVTAPTTAARDRQLLRTHLLPALGKLPLYAITPQDVASLTADIAAMANALTGTPMIHTARRAYAVLHKMLHDACDWGLLTANPAAPVHPPAIPHAELPFPTVDELCALIRAFHQPHRALVYVDIHTGLRWGELAAVEWSDLNLDAGTLSVRRNRPTKTKEIRAPKWSSQRVVPLFPAVVQALMDIPQRGPLVFPGARGGYLNYRWFHRHIWQPRVQQLGLKLEIKHMRHAFASLTLAFGELPATVARWLGHTTPALVHKTYGHIIESGRRLDRDETLTKLAAAYSGAAPVRPSEPAEAEESSQITHQDWSRRADLNR